jgi:hypothetical protein
MHLMVEHRAYAASIHVLCSMATRILCSTLHAAAAKSCYLQPVLIREANQDHGRICRLLQQPVMCVWYQYNTRGWSMKCEIKQLP